MGRGLGHLAAHMKDIIKNGSQIKIWKIPQISRKISKYRKLDHIYLLMENRVIEDPPIQLNGKFHYYYFLKPSLMNIWCLQQILKLTK